MNLRYRPLLYFDSKSITPLRFGPTSTSSLTDSLSVATFVGITRKVSIALRAIYLSFGRRPCNFTAGLIKPYASPADGLYRSWPIRSAGQIFQIVNDARRRPLKDKDGETTSRDRLGED